MAHQPPQPPKSGVATMEASDLLLVLIVTLVTSRFLSILLSGFFVPTSADGELSPDDRMVFGLLLLSGNAAQVPGSPLDGFRALTAHIALVVATDTQDAAYASIFAAGLILLFLTAGASLTVRRLGRSRGEVRRAAPR